MKSKLNVKSSVKTSYGRYTMYQDFEEDSKCIFKINRDKRGMDEINKKNGSMYGFSSETIVFNARRMNPEKTSYTTNYRSTVRVKTTEGKNKVKIFSRSYEPRGKTDNFCLNKDDEDIYAIEQLDRYSCVIEYRSDELIIDDILSPFEENAPRVEKALKHLIKECGGKDELF